MFGSLSLIAVGQKQHQRGKAGPFLLRGRDIMIDDRLRSRIEIAKLRLPEHKRLGMGPAISIFEGKTGKFRKRRIVDPEKGLFFAHMGKRKIEAAIFHIYPD